MKSISRMICLLMTFMIISVFNTAVTLAYTQEEKNEKALNAVCSGNMKDVKRWLDEGADVNFSSPNFGTLLEVAVKWNYYKVAELLIKRHAQINPERTYSCESPLHCAANNGYTNIAKLLIENGANVNATDGERETPLHKAARCGHKEISQLLINNNANIYAKNSSGETVLKIAGTHGHTEVVKLLQRKGAKN